MSSHVTGKSVPSTQLFTHEVTAWRCRGRSELTVLASPGWTSVTHSAPQQFVSVLSTGLGSLQ